MSFRLTAETPVLSAAPGEVVVGRVRIENDSSTDAVYTVSVVGIDADPINDLAGLPGPVQVPVQAGASATVEIPVPVPRSLGIGQHAAAFETTSSRANDRATLTPFTLSIASVARVELVPQPSTIRARRRADFHLDVTNNEAQPVEIELIGEAPDVRVAFTPSTFGLSPGQRIVARAKLKGPRHWAGEPTQHNVLITARGRAATTTATAAYVQRPLFARRLKMVVAAVTVVALWLGAIGGVAWWWSQRDQGVDATALVGVDTDGDGIVDAFRDADNNPVSGTDTDGDGIPDLFIDADGNTLDGIDTNGDGIPDTIVGGDGKQLQAIDTDGDGIPDSLSSGAPLPDGDDEVVAAERQTTFVRGSVDIDADPTSVDITLTALSFNDPDPENATPIGLRRTSTGNSSGKFWPARYGSLVDLFDSPVRRTVAIATEVDNPDGNGNWEFSDVIQGQSYEVSFRSAGFDTRSFVVTPEVDGDAVDLDVEMVPSRGALSGTVVRPGGVGLGSAAITVSDGNTTFSTSSESGTGAWSLDGLSTPGVYSVSAELRGFGTTVQQIELGAADTVSGITILMQPGLGTITGRVEDTGRDRLGGVTVTASNGESTLTTTTFTEGDIGFYSLPQLDVPGDYTVQAELDGYVIESRRVLLGGSAQNNVNFTMTSTTATLRGRVLSSAGGGIESAGLIISTGDLEFRASTAAAPDAGTFQLDRLPPGDYTITAEHFEHETATQFITLVAGRPPPPLVITLTETGGPPPVGTGSLTVNVVNDDPTINPPGITGTRVTLTLLRSDFQRTIENDDDFSVTFDDLPVGTYDVSIDATEEGYNNSAPQRRSIGLGASEPITFSLQRLGTASGTVINSLEPDDPPLTGYTVSLYRLANINDPVGTFFDSYPEQDGGWDTGERALQTGFWRIEVTSPVGFLVRPDQVIDTSPSVNGRAMVFLVPNLEGTSVLPQTILPVEADPLAGITGKIYRPRLAADVVEFDALDDNSLAVTGTCNGAAVPAGSIIYDSTFGANGLADTFSLSPTLLAEVVPPGEFPATCVFQVSATGRVPETLTFTGVGASDGSLPADQLGVAALVKTPQPLGGSVFWIDPGQDPDAREPLDGVAISSTDDVIVDFTPAIATAANPDPRPGISRDVVGTTSLADPAGDWDLSGHVFGIATYRFTTDPDQFTPGSVLVTIGDTQRTVAASGVNTVVTDEAAGRFGVQLTPPKPGTLSGRVSIRSESNPKSFAEAIATATTPSEADPKPTRTPDANGDFSFTSAEAGTWTIEFATPDNHQLLSNLGATPPGAATDQLLPGDQTLDGFDAAFVELGTVRVNAFDRSTGDAITTPLAIDLTDPGTIGLTGTVPDRASAVPDDGTTYTLDRIPVSADPSDGDVFYDMALSVTDFDLTRARAGSTSGPQVDATALELPMNAGRDTTYNLYLDPFRSINGSLLGRQTSGLPEGLSVDDDAPNPATMPVTRVDRFGDPLVTDDPEPRLVPGPNGTFSIVAPPGFYKLVPTHPQYLETPVQLPAMPPITDSQLPIGATLPAGVFELGAAADTELLPYEFRLRMSELSVRAVTKLDGGTPVDGAVFDLELDESSCNGFPATTTSTSIGLTGTTVSVAPGSYCLAINKFDGGEQIAFPAVILLTVPRSTDTVSTTTVVAPLPSLRPTLTGKLVAENADGDPVDLIATGPVITSRFTEATAVTVDTGSLGNLTPETSTPDGSVVRTRSATALQTEALPGVAWDGTWTYTLENVPYGENTVTAPAIEPTYTLPSPTHTVRVSSDDGATSVLDLATGDSADSVPPFVYTVATAPIEIDLGPGAFPSLDSAFDDAKATVSLTTKTVTGVGAERTYSIEQRDGSNILVVEGVAPTNGVSRLSFDDVLHDPVDNQAISIPLAVNAAGRRVASLNPGPNATKARWTGVVQQRTQPDSNPNDGIDDGLSPLQAGAVMTLASTTGGETYRLAPDPTVALPNSDGTLLDGIDFRFDVEPDTYELTVTQSGYTTATVPGIDLTGAVGTLVNRSSPVVIDRQASIIINTTTFGSLPAPSGLTVRLVDKNAPTAVLSPRPGTTTYDVRPGTYYAEATADAPYPRQQSSDLTVVIGNIDVPINLVLPRIARVGVTGVTAPVQATVALVGVTTPAAQTGPTPATFQFTNPAVPTAPAVTRAKVTAPGYRTQIVDVPSVIINEPAVAVDLKLDATITGTIAGATSGTVTATASGMDDVTGSVTNGSYTVGGLGVGSNGETKIWTLTYSKLGTGTTTGATPVTVEVTATNAPTGPAIVLNVRDIAYDFDVETPGPGNPIENATVEILDDLGAVIESGTTGADGLETVTVAENTRPTSWRVSHPDRLTRSGALGTLPTSLSQDIDVVLQPEITGDVFDTEDPAEAVVGATVIVCPSTATAAPCTTPTQADRSTTSVAGGDFALNSDLPQGSYTIWATSGTQQGSITLSINSQGRASTTPGSGRITIATPPP